MESLRHRPAGRGVIATNGRTVILKRLAALLALSGVALGLAACNTVEGAGKDVKATGSAIEKAAASAKPK